MAEFYLEPSILITIAGVVIGSLTLLWKFWAKQQDRKRLFRDDYKKEIEPLLDHFYILLTKQIWGDSELDALFRRNSIMSKRILQHLYTCPNTRFLYDMVKEMTEKLNELETKGVGYDEKYHHLDNVVRKFREGFYPIWTELKNSPNPDFGACEKCIEGIKLKHVQKYKKFLKNSDPKMWNLFATRSE